MEKRREVSKIIEKTIFTLTNQEQIIITYNNEMSDDALKTTIINKSQPMHLLLELGIFDKEVIAYIWAWHSFIFYRTYYVLDNSLKLKKFKIIFQPREKGSLHFRKKYFTLEYQKQIKTSYNIERRLFNCC